MSFPLPFPDDILEEIRAYSGNDKCCDCPSLDTDWASVSHGTLICLDCAGKHRSLGVHVSFVRSITMDTWSTTQLEMMKQGGNAQIRRFFHKLSIDNNPIQHLYCTKGAEHYREKLKERVDKIMSGEIVPEKRNTHRHAASPAIPTTSSSAKSSQSAAPVGNQFTSKFGEGPMGMTLTKDFRESAVVSKLIPGGQAQQNNVKVGDFVIRIAGKTMSNYDEIMHMIPLMSRPLEISFNRIQAAAKVSKPEPIQSSKSDSALPALNRGATNNFSNTKNTTDNNSKSVPRVAASSSDLTNQATTKVAGKQSPPTTSKTSPTSKNENSVSSSIKRAKAALQDDNDDDESEGIGARDDDDDDEEEEEDEEEDDDGDLEDYGNEPNDNDEPQHNSGVDEETKEHPEVNRVSSTNQIKEETNDPVKNLLVAGTVVKVLKGGNKWKTAVIKRVHKDGGIKVIYRDGTEESHIPPSRVALPTQTLKELGALQINDEYQDLESSQQQQQQQAANNASYDDAFESILNRSNEVEQEDFAVEEEDDLDEWIERDFEEDLELNNVRPEDTYFIPKNDDPEPLFEHQRIGGIPKAAMSSGSGDLSIEFTASPLGLTLSQNSRGDPQVIRVKDGGNADRLGVQTGDIVTQIGSQLVADYAEAMSLIGSIEFPVVIQFKRAPKGLVAESGEMLLRNTKILADKLMDSFGVQNPATIMKPRKYRLSNNRRGATDTTASSNDSKSQASRRLDPNPKTNEFDIKFETSEMGFRVEERMVGSNLCTIVTDVTDKGEGKIKGLSVNSILLGINFEPYLSHAHSVATLKYAKRPVVIRFRK